MGSDAGDINSDGWTDLITLDMAFEDNYKSKTNMGAMDPDRFHGLVAEGQYYQYIQNALQVNMGHGYFSEMGELAGVSRSDWSYASLFADLDIDGDQDILVTNGVLRDLRTMTSMRGSEMLQGMVGPSNYLEVLDILPSNPVRNIIYSNDGNMQFTKLPPSNGFNAPGFSQGMAYVDLDGDGLLDVVINNMNAQASIYKNTSTTNGHYLKIKLKGEGQNLNGLGTSVVAYFSGKKQIQTMQTSRGYFSSVRQELYYGLGNIAEMDSIKVYWNHKAMSVLKISRLIRHSPLVLRKKKIPFAVT
ncbi:MAG: CRTAC1 family protein [Saprospiraceae bacterium]|nr:CRTAC1 family protein [Candidatus Opimibacter iunctus]